MLLKLNENSNSDITSLINLITIPIPVANTGYLKKVISDYSLESVLKKAFRSYGRSITKDYFIEDSKSYPKNTSFVIIPYAKTKKYTKFIGCLIATNEEIDGFEFIYYDKIGVIPKYQGNGLMNEMIIGARNFSESNSKSQIDMQPKDMQPKPSVLRTSVDKLNEIYANEGDIKTTKEDLEKFNGFYVHGFGFTDKKTGEELFEYSEYSFQKAAEYVAKKACTVTVIKPD